MISSVDRLPSSSKSHPALERKSSLSELLRPRVAVEGQFARQGHTFRHGRVYRRFEHLVTRPALRMALKAFGLYGRGERNALSPVVRQVSLRFENLPAELSGFQILHLSDFHVEGTPGLTKALIPLLRQLRPDLCVMTGDYRFEDHGPCDRVYAPMQEIVLSIEARFGIFGILGNHDHSEIAFRMEEMGVRMLVNESVAIGETTAPLWLVGVDDPFDYRCHDLAKALTPVPEGSFQVLLAHAPELYEEAARAGIALYLSGHTHAGQIRVPGIGAIRRNARCPGDLVYGPWKYKGLQGYTSAGIGCSSLPVRFACPPEIVLIELLAGV